MISIIIPNYNKLQHLRLALGSALQQCCISEVVVVDDASTDGSLTFLRDMATRDTRLIIIENSFNRNASYCRNRGLERATGDFVIFFDSDDFLAPTCCENRLAQARRHPEYDLWVFPMLVFRETPDLPIDTWVPYDGNHIDHFLAHRLDWQTMQPLWRRDFLLRLGGFDESFHRFQDPELHLRALLAGARAKCFPDMLPDCSYRAFGDVPIDATAASARNAEAAVHFYNSFINKVAPPKKMLLAGTLLASLAMQIHWWRSGSLSTTAMISASRAICDSCKGTWQSFILRSYLNTQRHLPVRIGGLTRLAYILLGIWH